MWRYLHIVGVTLNVVGMSGACSGQPFSNMIDGFGLFKSGYFVQTDPATVVVDHYTFVATALEELTSTETIDGVELAWTDGGSAAQVASLSQSGIEWSYYDTSPGTYSSEAELTAVYPSANDYEYSIEVDGAGTFVESLDGPDDLYPDTIPLVTNYAELQAADPSSDIDIKFSGYLAPPEANILDIEAFVGDSMGFVWSDHTNNSTATSLTIPAGTLHVGTPYELHLTYEVRLLDSAMGAVFTNAYVNYTFEYTTELDLVVVPEPGTASLLAVALLGMSVLFGRNALTFRKQISDGRNVMLCKMFVPLLIALFVSFTSVDRASARLVYGVDAHVDSLYKLDLDTGDVTIIGRLHPDPNHYTTPVAMAVRPSDGKIFVINNSPDADEGLSTVDRGTGLATLIGGEVFGALAFDLDDTLYAIAFDSTMAIVDQTTGATTSLGGPALPNMYGLDFNPADGLLYGITGFSAALDLLVIDPNDGALLDTRPLDTALGGGSVAGTLLFDWAGRLHGTANSPTDNLFEIDPATGAVSNIRTAEEFPQGMGLIIPEPTTLRIVILLMATSRWWQRRHRRTDQP